jgi:hypothetical protein
LHPESAGNGEESADEWIELILIRIPFYGLNLKKGKGTVKGKKEKRRGGMQEVFIKKIGFSGLDYRKRKRILRCFL